jgi:hypothetical protein
VPPLSARPRDSGQPIVDGDAQKPRRISELTSSEQGRKSQVARVQCCSSHALLSAAKYAKYAWRINASSYSKQSYRRDVEVRNVDRKTMDYLRDFEKKFDICSG